MSQLPFYRRPISGKAVGKRILQGVAVAGAFALVPLAWDARPLRPEKEFGIALPPLPSPNAHDLYKQSDEAFSVEDKAARARGDKPVAAVLDWSSRTPIEDPKKYPLSAKEKWLAHNRRGFALFDRALQAEYVFPLATNVGPDGEIETSSHLRFLARYLSVECQVFALRKQPEKAVARALDLWQMGLRCERGAPVVPVLQTFAIEAIARRALDGEIAHLDGAQAARLARRLETLLQTRVPHRAILQAERDATLLHLKRRLEIEIRDRLRTREIERKIERGETISYGSEPAPALKGPLINWQTRRMAGQFERGMASLLEAKSSWPAPPANVPADIDEAMANLIRVLDKNLFSYTRADAFGQIALARLALHAFRKERGAYPQTLDELVPRYLKQAPRDAFAKGTLRYRGNGPLYKLWSIGPDARDDNARPAQNPNPRTPTRRYEVVADATGDIVANISR